MEQGRLAVRTAFLLKSHPFPDIFPYGIYTIPEISSIGPPEEELREAGVHYEVGRAHYYEIARADRRRHVRSHQAHLPRRGRHVGIGWSPSALRAWGSSSPQVAACSNKLNSTLPDTDWAFYP